MHLPTLVYCIAYYKTCQLLITWQFSYSVSAFASFREISDAFVFLSVSFNFTGVEELVAKCVLQIVDYC